ncbi:hypothetical protein CQY20_16530 [Mycolicibacterium agri]|nr:hypothetical protein [Mycolicibacterium agri]PEG37240.1 hypothetical protein CQY20_16530 [Mycolicibacterium agri]
MSLAPSNRYSADSGFAIEDVWTGLHASGFGQAGEGRSFSFHVEHQQLIVEVYRPRLSGPVPQAEDVIATATRKANDIDLFDERSLVAAVRDAVANAQPVPRSAR